MSMAALLQGVLQHLREDETYLGIVRDNNSEIVDEGGRPRAWSGRDLFFGVHPLRHYSGPSMGSQNNGVDEMFDVGITVTKRMGKIPPRSYMEKGYLEELAGLEPVVRAILVSMAKGRYTSVMAKANALLSSSAYPFVETLYWSESDAEPVVKGPEWFTAQGEDAVAYGWAITSQFVGARRLQNIDSYT